MFDWTQSKIVEELDAKLDEFLRQLNETQKIVFIQLYLSNEAKGKIVYKEIQRYEDGKGKHRKTGVQRAGADTLI